MKPAIPLTLTINGLLALMAAFALFPLLWMLSVSFMQPGSAGRIGAG